MVYYLFSDVFPGMEFITFRAAFAAVTAFLISIFLGPVVIRWLHQLQIKERPGKVHSERLADLHESKQEIPSMGGLFLIGGPLLSILLFTNPGQELVLLAMGVTFSFWVLGFVDDWIKLFSEHAHGISMGTKFLFQCLIALVAAILLFVYWSEVNPDLTELYIPVVSTSVDLGWFFFFWVALVVVSTANAVNLADGLDGLAVGLAVMVALVYAAIAYVTGRVDFSDYLGIFFVRGTGEVAIMLTAVVGGGIGFLWYNCYPAQIFMGNTGSMPLGALLGFAAVLTKQEILLILTGGVFVIEALSVGLQIASFQLFGTRIFRISPLHHHFEFAYEDRDEWEESDTEPKVVVRFWILATVFAIVSLALLTI